jgi:hypothetical protein
MLKFASNMAHAVRTLLSPRYAIIGNPSNYAAGSPEWLIAIEKHFGGLHTNVKRGTVSPRDPRTPAQLRSGGMTGAIGCFTTAMLRPILRTLGHSCCAAMSG